VSAGIERIKNIFGDNNFKQKLFRAFYLIIIIREKRLTKQMQKHVLPLSLRCLL
jgi:hypothetical protein